MKLKVAIIDDELHAIETLAYDIRESHQEQAEVIFTETDPIEGAQKVRTERPDLLFLDINMPGISGIDLMKLITDLDLNVILTTAHQEYAIQAVGSQAIAYLLKPIQPEDLAKAIAKAAESIENRVEISVKKSRIAIRNHDIIHLISLDDIVYCKSDGNYTEIHLVDSKCVLASKTLKSIAQNLPETQFVRIHKSYLINILHIKKYLKKGYGELIMSNQEVLPVSRNHQQEILKIIQTYL
jgi:two-component system, LytTR family, response regulator